MGSADWLYVAGRTAEGVMARVSRRWQRVWQFGGHGPFNDWERFELTERQNEPPTLTAPGFAQVGAVRFPPNARRGIVPDFACEEFVDSYADDWLTYPNFADVEKSVNRETWNRDGDYERGYLYWWMSHIPRNTGTHDGLLNNWWRYILNANMDPDQRF